MLLWVWFVLIWDSIQAPRAALNWGSDTLTLTAPECRDISSRASFCDVSGSDWAVKSVTLVTDLPFGIPGRLVVLRVMVTLRTGVNVWLSRYTRISVAGGVHTVEPHMSPAGGCAGGVGVLSNCS